MIFPIRLGQKQTDVGNGSLGHNHFEIDDVTPFLWIGVYISHEWDMLLFVLRSSNCWHFLLGIYILIAKFQSSLSLSRIEIHWFIKEFFDKWFYEICLICFFEITRRIFHRYRYVYMYIYYMYWSQSICVHSFQHLVIYYCTLLREAMQLSSCINHAFPLFQISINKESILFSASQIFAMFVSVGVLYFTTLVGL